MKRVGILLACAILAAGAPPGSGQQVDLCDDGDVPDLETCRAAALDAAAAYMATQEPRTFHFEAAAAAQADPLAWPSPGARVWGDLSIPAPDGSISEAQIRPYHAAASLGMDMRAFPDPERGVIDLVAEAEALHPQVMASNYPALLAWHLWNLHAFGDAADAAKVDDAATRLAAMQRLDGGWACTSPAFVSPDCGAWAATALAMHGRLDGLARDRAVAYFESGYDGASGGYSDQGSVGVNTITTALIINAYRALDRPDELRDDTWAYLLGRQDPGGGFALREGSDPDAWTTRTASMAVSAAYPFPRSAPVDVTPAEVHVGNTSSRVEGDFEDATWHCGDRRWEGLVRTMRLEVLDPPPCRVHALGDGVHGWSTYHPTVRNDPPRFEGLPHALELAPGQTFEPVATDPEGFPVQVTWRIGTLAGNGVVDRVPGPGEHGLHLQAADPHGGVAQAVVHVHVPGPADGDAAAEPVAQDLADDADVAGAGDAVARDPLGISEGKDAPLGPWLTPAALAAALGTRGRRARRRRRTGPRS